MKRIWTGVDSSLLRSKHGGATIVGVGSGVDNGGNGGGGGSSGGGIDDDRGGKKKKKKKKQADKLSNVLQSHFLRIKNKVRAYCFGGMKGFLGQF
ncbi:hypothetical protein SDJN03_03903, partial [Cucurbita argyrosperma subsp. sororia]